MQRFGSAPSDVATAEEAPGTHTRLGDDDGDDDGEAARAANAQAEQVATAAATAAEGAGARNLVGVEPSVSSLDASTGSVSPPDPAAAKKQGSTPDLLPASVLALAKQKEEKEAHSSAVADLTTANPGLADNAVALSGDGLLLPAGMTPQSSETEPCDRQGSGEYDNVDVSSETKIDANGQSAHLPLSAEVTIVDTTKRTGQNPPGVEVDGNPVGGSGTADKIDIDTHPVLRNSSSTSVYHNLVDEDPAAAVGKNPDVVNDAFLPSKILFPSPHRTCTLVGWVADALWSWPMRYSRGF